MVSLCPVPGYALQRSLGHGADLRLLVEFMQATYLELRPQGKFAHLEATIAAYFSSETPLWLVETEGDARRVGCLWVGNGVDQLRGDRYTHVLLLYVVPDHRRKGIGSALMAHAENWAQQRGDRQLGLQVFEANLGAVTLYGGLGYQTQSLFMIKPLQRAPG